MRDQIEEIRPGGAVLRAGRTLPRRRRGAAPGPRPVRPRVVPVAARPAQPSSPGRDGSATYRGERVLLRTVPVLPPRVLRRRRVAATVGMALLAAAVVVLLGLLADVAAAARHSGAGEATGASLTAVVPSAGQVVDVVRR
jgi:hypothetical protein